MKEYFDFTIYGRGNKKFTVRELTILQVGELQTLVMNLALYHKILPSTTAHIGPTAPARNV